MARQIRHGSIVFLSLLLASLLLCGAPAWAQDEEDETPRLFPLAPRELRQPLTRAADAVDEKRFGDAVQELAAILNNSTADDYFIAPQGADGVQTSLRAAAQQMLGEMPAEGRRLYELQLGAEARAMLEEALKQGDDLRLAEVARRFFHTKAGYEATLLLGRFHLDRGRPLAAALMLQRVATAPSAARLYDPELTVLLAGAWNAAGMRDKAETELLSLKKRQPNAKLAHGAKSIPLFTTDADAIPWLTKLVGEGDVGEKLASAEWVMFRGNETRNAATSGSLPVVNFRWTVPTLNDPQTERRVRDWTKQKIDRDESIVPSLQPLAAKDYVLVRTPDLLMGIDMRSGKRVWVSWWEDSGAKKTAQPTPQFANNTQAASVEDQQTRQRIWDDSLFGQLSSDGEQVYVVDDLSAAPVATPGVPRGMWFGNRNAVAGTASTNRLKALELRSQGKLRWIVGGPNGEDDPRLAGAFFVGTPLPIAGQLYVIAEFNGELRLLCLSAKTGQLEWKQQLAVMEDMLQIRVDGVRRLAGATPSFADGVLVCPTSAGGVVAVDLATRALRWGYQYPRWDMPSQRFNGGINMPSNRQGQTNETWQDSSVTISGGRVLLTPPESRNLHCLNLLTGEKCWEEQPRGSLLYVGCVHDEKAILVGKDEVRAINLADGKPAWEPLSLEGESPSGRGYYSEHFYFLPTTGSQLVKIDLETGKIVGRAKTEIQLGNLICYQDELISVSPTWVAAFSLSEPLRARVETALKANPDDIWALCSKAELLLQEKHPDEALALLRRANALDSREVRPRTLLVKTMLGLLRDDFAKHRDLVAEAAALTDQPVQRRELLQLHARGLQDAGMLSEAFDVYRELGAAMSADALPTSEGAELLVPFQRDLRVLPERWMRARLQSLYAAADEAVQERMTAALRTDFDAALKWVTTAPLRQFIARYNFHPLADEARLALAERMLMTHRWLDAESLMLPLRGAADRAIAGQATAVLAETYTQAGRHDQALLVYKSLRDDFAAVVCRKDMTGEAIAAQVFLAQLRAELPPRVWPSGKVVVNVGDSDGGNSPNSRLGGFQSNFPIQISQWNGIEPNSLRATFDNQQYSVMLRDGFGRVTVTAPLRAANTSFQRFGLQANGLSGQAIGNLLVVHLGAEVVAIDGLQSQRDAAEVVVWRQDMLQGDGRNNFYNQHRTVTNPILGTRALRYDQAGQVNYAMGPLTSEGIALQRGRQLTCIDPLSGQPVWERSPIDAASTLFGDDELLFVCPPNGSEAVVLSAVDGSELGRRKVAKQDERLTTFGRNVLSFSQSRANLTLQLANVWDAGAPLWQEQVAPGSKGCLIDDDEFAILEPNGRLIVVSLADGKVRFSSELQPEEQLTHLTVQRSSGRYIVIAHQVPTEPAPNVLVQPVPMAMAPPPLVHGHVYSLDHGGKQLWPAPAFVSQHYLLNDQPPELPLLFFLRNTRGASDAKWTSEALVLDKQTGGVDYDAEIAPSQLQSADIVTDLAQNSLVLRTWISPGFKTITFKLTNDPAPPQPPAQLGAQASATAGEQPGVAVDDPTRAMRALRRRNLFRPANRNAPAPQPVAPADQEVPADQNEPAADDPFGPEPQP